MKRYILLLLVLGLISLGCIQMGYSSIQHIRIRCDLDEPEVIGTMQVDSKELKKISSHSGECTFYHSGDKSVDEEICVDLTLMGVGRTRDTATDRLFTYREYIGSTEVCIDGIEMGGHKKVDFTIPVREPVIGEAYYDRFELAGYQAFVCPSVHYYE